MEALNWKLSPLVGWPSPHRARLVLREDVGMGVGFNRNIPTSPWADSACSRLACGLFLCLSTVSGNGAEIHFKILRVLAEKGP